MLLVPEQITGIFAVRIGREILTYSTIGEIPESFDNLIRFEPDYPEPPHSLADHEAIAKFPSLLAELLRRETRASRNTNR